MTSRRVCLAGVMALAVSSLVLASSPALAQHGGMGGPAPRGPVEVHVTKVDPSGSQTPLAGAHVVLERWVGDGGRPPNLASRASGMAGMRMAEALVMMADGGGVARFTPSPLGMGQMLVASVIHDGRTFGGDQVQPGSRPVQIDVYDATEDVSRVKMDLFLGVFVDEKMVIAEVNITFDNPDPVLVDVDRRGLRLPMLLPAVMGGPVEGILPDEALRNIANQRNPVRGRLRMEKGYVVYRGPILPGDQQQIRLRYGIPIERSRQDIAIQHGELDAKRVRVLARWSNRIAPRLVPNRSFTAFEREQGEFRQRQILLDDPLPAGTPLLLYLDRLPHALSAEAAVALIGTLLLLGLFGLALLAPTRKRRVPEAAEGPPVSVP